MKQWYSTGLNPLKPLEEWLFDVSDISFSHCSPASTCRQTSQPHLTKSQQTSIPSRHIGCTTVSLTTCLWSVPRNILRKADCLLIPLLLLLTTIRAFAQSEPSSPVPLRLMQNSDVIRMVEDGVKPGVIISNIFTSHCNFDIFPPVLRDLKRRGVPDTVIAAMKMAPNGPPAIRGVEPKEPTPPPVTIPSGTIIEVETARAVSSLNSPPGTRITFLVTRRIYVNKVLVIDRGAVARASVVKSKPARRLGRAGMLAWEMEYVVGIDGSQIPIQLAGKQTGANRTAAMAGGALATGALLFPYTSPIGLIWD